jgi:hypothetical protein
MKKIERSYDINSKNTKTYLAKYAFEDIKQDLQKEGIGLDELKFKVPPTKEQILENLDQQNSFTSKDKSTLQMFILSEQQQLGPLFHGQ